MNIYLSSSWKNRERVHLLAMKLRKEGYDVYDFTDQLRRKEVGLAPENFPTLFDPDEHIYKWYLEDRPELRKGVEENRKALERCDAVVMLLPCGNDAHADAYYGKGFGKKLIISGQPRRGDVSPTHLWADEMVDYDGEVPQALARLL